MIGTYILVILSVGGVLLLMGSKKRQNTAGDNGNGRGMIIAVKILLVLGLLMLLILIDFAINYGR